MNCISPLRGKLYSFSFYLPPYFFSRRLLTACPDAHSISNIDKTLLQRSPCRRNLKFCPSSPLVLGLEELEGAHEIVPDRHHGTGIVELTAVVRRGEECDHLAAREELVAVLDDLVRAHDEVKVVLVQEVRDDVRAEDVGDATVVLGPSSDVRL